MSVAPADEPLRGFVHGRQVGALGRQMQQTQAAVGMARAQPVERLLGARQRIVQGRIGNAVAADRGLACELDILMNRHGICVQIPLVPAQAADSRIQHCTGFPLSRE